MNIYTQQFRIRRPKRVDILGNKSGPGHKLLDKHLHTAIPNSTGEDQQKSQEQSMSAIIQDKRTQVP
jgi:hypothetical protein